MTESPSSSMKHSPAISSPDPAAATPPGSSVIPSERSLAEGQRRREGVIILCTALAVLLFAFFETSLPRFVSNQSLSNNVVFFLLINLNIILLVLLVFLVARNLVKLVFERRRRMLGSRLRTRLVAAFVAVSILPAVLIFLFSFGIMNSSIKSWFNDQVKHSLEGSLEIAQAYYTRAADTALTQAEELAARLRAENLLASERERELDVFVAGKRREYAVGAIEVFGVDGRSRAAARVEGAMTGARGGGSSVLTAAFGGQPSTRVESVGEGDVIRGAAPIFGAHGVIGAVVIDMFVPKSIADRGADIARSFQEYRQLAILKQPITTNYTITLSLVTLLVIFSAIWVGLYTAKGITVPIQKLAEGTREVAQGNWQYRIGLGDAVQVAPDDEFGSLVGSFNQMTQDLEAGNRELERRGRYMETILANMAGGVVSVDRANRVTTINDEAERLLGIDGRAALGVDVREVFTRADLAPARELLAELRGGQAPERIERQMKLVARGRELTVVVTATVLRDVDSSPLGAFLFFENVTDIVKAQRMEAWREVARRIAHEIKNPLTPIQLSAQRMRKRYAHLLRDDPTFDECTRTIVAQVDGLKALVNEFATFARLPAGEHRPENLNALVEEAVVLFREGHREIRFVFDADPAVPLLPLDREGFKRAIINILDNAVAAIGVGNGVESRIDMRTRYNRAHGIVALEIADTGCGISPDVRARLFEPYFSTKQGGTGLGLAIVSTIVADHRGFVRVKNNDPCGSRFVVELPVQESGGDVALH